MNREQKFRLFRICLAAILTAGIFCSPASGIPLLILYLVPYLLIGHDVLKRAFQGLLHREPFDECLLMTIATIGALAIAFLKTGEYAEAVAVMIFYQTGELFEDWAVIKSRKNITSLMDLRPETASVLNENGGLKEVPAATVPVGTLIAVKPGERIPLDGIVIEGCSGINTAALTGESLPRDAEPGTMVHSGTVNLTGLIKIRTEKSFDDSQASKILELIETASLRKSRSERFVTKFARIYTPLVVYAALALSLLPPLVLTLMDQPGNWSEWCYRALTFLVISCPCALVISIPLSFFAGVGGASRKGILIKGTAFMEVLAKTEAAVFDKTGTLTAGSFEVTALKPAEDSHEEELLSVLAHAEQYSDHPAARAVRKTFGNRTLSYEVSDYREIPGRGVSCRIRGFPWDPGKEFPALAGNRLLLQDLGIVSGDTSGAGTAIHAALDRRYLGHAVIADSLKSGAEAGIAALRTSGISRIAMLTGDTGEAAREIAAKLGIQEFHAGLLPKNKLEILERIISECRGTVIFAGDGINDAPVLARADAGIAMGGLGTDIAISSADVVLMDDDPGKIAVAVQISRKCLRIVRENIWFIIGIKVCCLILGALGLAGMWLAVFADVGVMILAVLNAMRCLFTGNAESPEQGRNKTCKGKNRNGFGERNG